MIYTYIPPNTSGATLDFSIFTLIGILICTLVMLFGMIRVMRSAGDPNERQSGVVTILYGAILVPTVLIFIEIPHTFFF